jgi:NNP family nitrate/nitrite transporter-like MFS transporter
LKENTMAGSAPLPTSAPAGRTLNLVLATSASVVCFWAWNSVATLGSFYTQNLQLNPATTGVLVATPVFVGSLGRIVVGTLTDRYGGRAMFTFVLLASILPILLVALGGTLSSFAVVLGAGLLRLRGAASQPGSSARAWAERRSLLSSIPASSAGSATSPPMC